MKIETVNLIYATYLLLFVIFKSIIRILHIFQEHHHITGNVFRNSYNNLLGTKIYLLIPISINELYVLLTMACGFARISTSLGYVIILWGILFQVLPLTNSQTKIKNKHIWCRCWYNSTCNLSKPVTSKLRQNTKCY